MAWYDNITYLSSNPFLSMGNIRNPVLSDAFHSNNPLRNNQNTDNQGLGWWMNNDRSRYPSPMMPGMLDQTGQMGASNYRGPQGIPFDAAQGNIPYAPEEKTGIFSKFTTPVMSALKGIKDQFEYKPATEEAWDPNTGQFVSAEEQDKMNALGGYYSDAARNQRRQRARVINMIKRRDAKQAYSKKNLARLQDLGYGPKETITTTTVGDNINQGGGGYDRGYTQSQRAGVEAYHGRGGGKEMMSQGGRIGYALGTPDPDEPTEDIFEFIKDQNIPIGEQVQGDPFDLRIQELMGKGLSYDDAYDIAAHEFQDLFAEGPDQDQGLASLV